MKGINTNYTFNPSLKQVDFSTTPSFDVRRLTAIINTTANQIIYASGKSGYGIASVAGSVVTLQYDTTSMSASDKLSVFYDNTVISVDTGLSQPLTDTQLRASAIPVSGSVSITNSNIEITNDVGNPIPVSGTVNTGLSQPLTDTQLRATAVPISGSVSVSNLPATQTVAGTVTANIGTTNGIALDATLTGGNQVAIMKSGAKGTTTAAQVTSTAVDANTQALDVSVKGTPTVSVSNFPATQTISGTVTANAGTGTFQTNITNASIAVTGPLTDTQLRAAAVPVSGTITGVTNTVTVKADTLANQTNAFKVDGSAVTQPVSGSVSVSNFPATQTVTGTVAISNSSIEISNDVGNPIPVNGSISVSNFPATQAVSAASLPLPSGASTSALQTSGNLTLTSIDNKTPSLGQAVMASSTPVVIASNQTTIPVEVKASSSVTYSSAIVGGTIANNATDIFTIYGSATKTIRVTRLAITATQTTAAQRDLVLIKRSTANTAGTSTAPNKVPHDSTSVAATATVLSYTANPTLGTSVGNVRSRKVYVGTTAGNSDECIFEFGTRGNQAIVLRGTNEGLCVNLNSVTSFGGLWDISVEWVEE